MDELLQFHLPTMMQAVDDGTALYHKMVAGKEDLVAKLRPFETEWTGPARDAYHASMAKLQAALDELGTHHLALVQRVQTNHENFAACERAVTNRFTPV